VLPLNSYAVRRQGYIVTVPAPPEPDDPVVAVFKLGQHNHMQALLDEGLLYLQTVNYFRGLDDGTPRGDALEASSYCLHLDGWTVDVEDDLRNWQRLGNIVGGASIGDTALGTANLYCLHARRRSQCKDPFLLADLGYGPACVVLRDASEFFKRIQDAVLRLGQSVQFGLVDYLDKATYHGRMGPFRKYGDHRSDSEFRILVTPGLGKPLELRLGSLRGIAMLLPTSNRILATPNPAP
jgi:hypothetical protein